MERHDNQEVFLSWRGPPGQALAASRQLPHPARGRDKGRGQQSPHWQTENDPQGSWEPGMMASFAYD